jgi:hypothetical protein
MLDDLKRQITTLEDTIRRLEEELRIAHENS